MMRNTFATRWIEAGMRLKDVSEFFGHTSVTTTEMHTHVTIGHLINSFDKFEATR
jgi:site-specific recombinase XerD